MDNWLLMNVRDLPMYRSYVERRERSPGGYEDAEFMRLFHVYLQSKEIYLREAKAFVEEAFRELDARGPRRFNFDREFYRINNLRRFFERDAYAYFHYRPGIHEPSPAGTIRWETRDRARDVSLGQLLGRDDRASDEFRNALMDVEEYCKRVNKAYDDFDGADEDLPERLKHLIVSASELVDLMGADGDEAVEVKRLVGDLLSLGVLVPPEKKAP